jgi:hypothetical protein
MEIPRNAISLWLDGDTLKVTFPESVTERVINLPHNAHGLESLLRILQFRAAEDVHSIATPPAPIRHQLEDIPQYFQKREAAARKAAEAHAVAQAKEERKEERRLQAWEREKQQSMSGEELFEYLFEGAPESIS